VDSLGTDFAWPSHWIVPYQALTGFRIPRLRPALKGSPKNTLSPRPGSLPSRMRVLYVTTYQRTGGWLAEALAADSASEVVLEEAVGFAAGLSRLRDDVFDAVLIGHEPDELDATALVEALRTAGSEEPVIVLGQQDEADMTALCLEAHADAYVCVRSTTTRTLIWVVARAIEHHFLLRENRRLQQADRHRLEMERGEADRLLAEQQGLLRELDLLSSPQQEAAAGQTDETAARPPLPEQLEAHYRELLRAYVMMGSGNLATEMHALAQWLATAGISAAQTLELHLHVLHGVLKGLGTRSARHVMNRADLLALEVGVHLCEVYRQRSTAAAP
jgi:DNA-binding response OmpR family regulator